MDNPQIVPKYTRLVTRSQPRYNHDCATCKFVGQFGAEDIYICPKFNLEDATIIRRNSSDGPDYSSFNTRDRFHGQWFRISMQNLDGLYHEVWNFRLLNLVSELMANGIIVVSTTTINHEKIKLITDINAKEV